MNTRHLWAPPPEQPENIVEWAEKNVVLVGSVLSEKYDSALTPWTIEPLRACADRNIRRVTLVKPIQTGGSRVGLIALCWWSKYGHGQIQYNWEKAEKAEDKWQSETLPTLEACKVLDWSGERFQATSCHAKFLRSFIRAQGVWIPENLDSDSIPFQINEEVHAWKPGHLAKARGRQTAVTFPKSIDISNAGMVDDQLHAAYQSGTARRWQSKCPGCGGFHIMQTRWDDRTPERGGLRYDADNARLPNGLYNYNVILPTIYYQMPCGHKVTDNRRDRRAMSVGGKYSEPTNAGALSYHESYSYDCVAVDFIPWVVLIQEKHNALRALRAGDGEPWKKYIQERECNFYDAKDGNPFVGKIIVNTTRSKSRAGLDGRAARFAVLDRQKGLHREGESPHWWMVVRDVMPNGDSELVFEGKLYTEEDIKNTMAEYSILKSSAAMDATWDTSNVTDLAFRLGVHCLFVTGEASFSHGTDGRKIFSKEEALHKYLNRQPKFDYVLQAIPGTHDVEMLPAAGEPAYWRVSKYGMMDRLGWVRGKQSGLKWEVPGDVSEDYKQQIDSWSWTKLPKENAKTKEDQYGWQQVARHDHLHFCECGIALFMEMAGLIGVPTL